MRNAHVIGNTATLNAEPILNTPVMDVPVGSEIGGDTRAQLGPSALANTRVQPGPRGQTAKDGALRSMGVGALLCVAGIVITSVTYSNASQSGGTYLIMWGPVVFGGWQFLKGLARLLAGD